MKSTPMLLAAACLFAARTAHADDSLSAMTELGIVLGKSVTLHDACVKQGLIASGNATAADEFDHMLDRVRAGTGMKPPAGMTLRQAAETIQAGYDFAIGHIAQKPLTVNATTCGDLNAHWSDFAKTSGLE